MPQAKKSKKSKKRETPTQEEEHQDSDASELSSQAQVDTFRRRDVKKFEFPDADEKKLDFFKQMSASTTSCQKSMATHNIKIACWPRWRLSWTVEVSFIHCSCCNIVIDMKLL